MLVYEPGLRIVVGNLEVSGKVLPRPSVKPPPVFENIRRAQQSSFTVGTRIGVDLAGILRGTHGERRRWVGAEWGGVW